MNLADLHFIRPYWFIALLPVAIFITLSVKNRLARGNWAEVCDVALLPYILQETNTSTKHRWSFISLSLASIIAIIALSGPTWERLPTPAFRNDAALVIALDLSSSMDASDIKPSRLVRAHYKITDILKQRKDGLTALIVYAGDAFTVTPLTEDTATIASQIKALKTDIMPSQGRNTIEALNLAVNLMQQAGQQQGDILLITDAVDSTITKQASSLLADYSLSIMGVGTEEGAPVKLSDGGFLKDRQGNIVIPKLNVAELSALAQSENGIYQTISTDDRDINAFIANLNHPKTQITDNKSQKLLEQWDDKGPWLLLLILPLVASYFRKGLLIIPLVFMLHYPQESYAFGWQDLWQTKDQQALEAFNQQQFDTAGQQFQSPQWKAAAEYKAGKYDESAATLNDINTGKSYYNQANALAKAGKLQQAIDAYTHALTLNPDHEDAHYNKNVVEQALKKQQEKQQQQQSDSNKEQDKQQKEQSQNQQQQQSKNQQQEQSKNDQMQSEQQDKSQQGQSKPKDQDKKQDNNEDSDAQQAEKQNQQKQEQKNSSSDNEEQKQQNKSEKKADDIESKQNEPQHQDSAEQKTESVETSAEKQQQDENKYANEQWLKRIPDDPSGLLKRKFKYQYQQRNQGSH